MDDVTTAAGPARSVRERSPSARSLMIATIPARRKGRLRALLSATLLLLPGGGLATDALAATTPPGPEADGSAQAPGAEVPPAGEDLSIHLLTMGPGDEVWERFGHNALWIHDAATGEDVVYNWGIFSFEEEGFLLRFLQGEMIYWMDGFPLDVTLREYETRNRSIWVQELALTPEQREELREFVEWNRLPRNRHYRYDYFRDNCSTRVRDVLDLALDGQLRRAGVAPGRGSYRWHARRLVQDDFVIDRGMHVLLGPRSDAPLSRWEEAFLPMELMRLVEETTVREPDGADVPLVRSTRTLFQAERDPEPQSAPGFGFGLLAAGLVLGSALALLPGRTGHPGPGGRAALVVLGGAWCLLSAFFGTILVLGWLWTDHVFLHGNENVLQMNPLSLALLPAFVAGVAGGRGLPLARALALLVLVVSAAGLLLEVSAGFVQENLDVIALALPAHAGLAAALLRVGSRA